MKKNWFLRIGLIALVLAIATTCLVGGTFAKYTTTVSGNDTIEVARFLFEATDGAVELDTPTAAIDLFADAEPVVADGTVAAGNIAPGVGGTFMLVFDATTTDVDLVLTGSKIETIITGGGTGLTTSTDFISYKIAWGVGGDVTAAGTAAVLPATYYSAAPESQTDIRHSLASLDASLTGILDGFVVMKGTALVVKVAYEWVDTDTEADNTADTAIGQYVTIDTAIDSTVTVVASQKITANVGGDYTTSNALQDKVLND